MLFDEPYYLQINEARWRAAADILDRLSHLDLRTCLDLGCGPGWFSKRLHERGFAVAGIDGRTDLVEVARKRCPDVTFEQMDIEAPSELRRLQPADLVFCFGLLYHLENPFAFVRRLRSCTARVLLLETILAPGDDLTARLVEEGRNETQGLTHHCMIPTRPTLAKMLSVAGFAGIYEWSKPIDHPDFREDARQIRRRSVLLCLPDGEIEDEWLARLPVPHAPKIAFLK